MCPKEVTILRDWGLEDRLTLGRGVLTTVAWPDVRVIDTVGDVPHNPTDSPQGRADSGQHVGCLSNTELYMDKACSSTEQ